MGRLIAACSAFVPPLFRLSGTAESIGTTGLFRRSGRNCPNAHVCTHERIFLLPSLIIIFLRVQVKKLGGTPEQACINAGLRRSGYPEQRRNNIFCRNNRKNGE